MTISLNANLDYAYTAWTPNMPMISNISRLPGLRNSGWTTSLCATHHPVRGS